jgi:site-specific DNA recombinase
VKGARRYRYYVSRKLSQGKADKAHRGWRLPAAEIEGIVAGAARQILDDEKAVLDAVQNAEIASNQIPEIIQSADVWSRRLKSAAECTSALSILVDRVELSPDGFRLTLKLPTQLAQNAVTENHANVAVSRFIRMKIKRRGVELRLCYDFSHLVPQNRDGIRRIVTIAKRCCESSPCVRRQCEHQTRKH